MISYPFISKTTPSDPYGDRAIDHRMERTFNKMCWSNGVFMTSADGSNLQVVANGGMTVGVMPGGCHIEGTRGYEQNKRIISISAAHTSLKRIDRIVARMDDSDSVRSIEIYKKEGVSSTTPTAPELVRESNYYEIALADIYVMPGATEITNANIVDVRQDRDLCGLVIPAFPTPMNLEAITTQYITLLKAAVNNTVAGQLQNGITEVKQDIQKLKASTNDIRIDNVSAENELASFFGASIRA